MHANRIVMKLRLLSSRLTVTIASLAAALVLAGCASTGGESSASAGAQPSSKFKLADGRTVDIGTSSPAEGGGMNYKNRHLEKCWLADGFDFNGYDTLYIAPVLSTAKFHQENPGSESPRSRQGEPGGRADPQDQLEENLQQRGDPRIGPQARREIAQAGEHHHRIHQRRRRGALLRRLVWRRPARAPRPGQNHRRQQVALHV